MSGIAQRTRHKGVFTSEFIIGIALLMLVMAGLTISVVGISRFNHYQWTRQRCTAAASAQLDSLSAAGEPIADAEIERLWPTVSVATERTPGGRALGWIGAASRDRHRQGRQASGRRLSDAVSSEG